jgi:hypothetical protein
MIKSTIIDDYITWLTRYLDEKQDCTHEQSASTLIEQLKSISTLDELSHLLSHMTFNIPSTIASPHPEDRFISKFNFTHTLVKQLNEAQIKAKEVCVFLEKIPTNNKQTTALIALIKKIMTEPRTFLYGDTVGLLALLEKAEVMQKMVVHLERQPEKACPENPAPGSFDEMIHLDDMHKASLDLLRNNAAVYQYDCPVIVHANQLLQKLSLLYNVLYTPAPQVILSQQADNESWYIPCSIL